MSQHINKKCPACGGTMQLQDGYYDCRECETCVKPDDERLNPFARGDIVQITSDEPDNWKGCARCPEERRLVMASNKSDKVPGWEPENELAKRLGFTCVFDPHRGGEWSRFRIGQWHVWRASSWQVARVVDDQYTEHLTKTGVEPVQELEVALRYALARHEGNTEPASPNT